MTAPAARLHADEDLVPLSGLEVGAQGRVVRLDLDDEQRGWLTAVGVGPGELVSVLRRAVLGGPLHVRTGAGGEFAVNRALAKHVVVERLP